MKQLPPLELTARDWTTTGRPPVLLRAYHRAQTMLQQAMLFEEVVQVRDEAKAFRAYAVAAKDREMEALAGELRMRAERRAGEMLVASAKTGDRHGKGQPEKKCSSEGTLLLPTLKELGITRKESMIWQRIAAISDRDFEARIKLMREENARWTSSKPFLATAFSSSKSNEWLTPPEVIAAVVAMLGEIDLDPCSNGKGSRANVPANRHFVKAEDGLSMPWEGSVFMNPPYGDAVPAWVERLVMHCGNGEVNEAIALVAARTDADWFRLFECLHPSVCFVSHRLRFSGLGPAPFPSAIIYLGDRHADFAEHFAAFGSIYKCIVERPISGRAKSKSLINVLGQLPSDAELAQEEAKMEGELSRANAAGVPEAEQSVVEGRQ